MTDNNFRRNCLHDIKDNFLNYEATINDLKKLEKSIDNAYKRAVYEGALDYALALSGIMPEPRLEYALSELTYPDALFHDCIILDSIQPYLEFKTRLVPYWLPYNVATDGLESVT